MDFTETMLKTRVCILDGIDGPKNAWCFPLKSEDDCAHVIRATDSSVSINVGKRIVESRFADSDKPTFYYS